MGTKFRSRITAIVINEAYCVDEWGGEDFRPQFRQLSNLRNYTGQGGTFLRCTATCRTTGSTFDTIRFPGTDFGERLQRNLSYRTPTVS